MFTLSDTVNRKFVDSIDLDDWEIDTPSGFQPLTKIHKTIPYELWFLKTDQGLTLECADNHIVYDKNNQEIFVKDCIPYQTMIKTRNGLQRVIECINLGQYENMYDPEVDSEDHTYWSNDILSHNTITVCAFLLYQSIFNKDYFIAILANNASKSREILSRVKLMYELLPWWLKPGVVEWNKGSIEFSNGSKIFAGPTTTSSIRGYSINCLYCLSGESVITIKEDDHIKDVTINELMGLIEDDQDIFLDNKYSRVYWNLINKAKTRILEDHVKIEKHHIFPISIFGKNNNLVSLTLREHFFAHKLLVKMTKGKNKAKMVIAAFKMAHNMKKFLMMPSCKYETLKKEFSSIMKEKMTGMKRKNLHNKDPEKIRKTAEKHRGMKRTEETKQNKEKKF